MSVNLTSNITWSDNHAVLSGDRFHIKVPPALANTNIRQPNFVDVAGMQRVTRQGAARGSAGSQLRIVNGLVTKDMKVRFENPLQQWQCTPAGGPSSKQGPGKFQFQGGNVMLELALGIYILNINQPGDKDKLSVEIFATVYSHELLHVLDEIDILKNWTLAKIPNEPTFARYLVKGEPYVFGNQTQNIFQVEQAFRPFIQERIETEVFNLWAEESNRRESRRDSPSEYKIVQDRIDDLRRQQINRP